MSPRMQEQRSTASTCFKSLRIASRRSISKAARCLARFPRPAAVVTQGWPGLRGRSGWEITADGRFIRSIRRTGAILRTIESNRFVTGVTWVDGDLWHATSEGDESELRHIDPRTGEVLEKLEMPRGVYVSGLESDGGDQFFCGGGENRKGQGSPAASVIIVARSDACRRERESATLNPELFTDSQVFPAPIEMEG